MHDEKRTDGKAFEESAHTDKDNVEILTQRPAVPEGVELNEIERLARQMTDDRGDAELFDFEKTWGHRLLAGCGVVMFVVALVLIIYCVSHLASLWGLGLVGTSMTLGFMLYTVGLVGGIILIAPGILALYVAKHPKRAIWAIVASLVAFALIFVFIACAITLFAQARLFSICLYACLMALLPAIYLIASVKIHLSR